MIYAVGAIQIALLIGCVLLWFKAWRNGVHSGALMVTRPQEVSPVGVIDIGLTVMVWFAMQVVGVVLLSLVFGIGGAAMSDMPAADLLQFSGLLMGLQLLVTVIATGYLIARHKRVSWLGRIGNLAADVRISGIAFLMIVPLTMVIQAIVTQFMPYEHPTLGSLEEDNSFVPLLWAWFAAGIAAPITEEFFFRGLIQGWLQRVFDRSEPLEFLFVGGRVDSSEAENDASTKAAFENEAFENEAFENGAESRQPPTSDGDAINPYRSPNSASRAVDLVSAEQGQANWYRFWMPIVITSLIFAAVHIGQGPAPIPLFFFSLGIGFLFRKTGSLVPCVLVHFLLNITSLTLFTLQLMYPELAPVEPEVAPAWFVGLFNF